MPQSLISPLQDHLRRRPQLFDYEKASQRVVKEGVAAGGIAKPAIPHTFCHSSEALLLQSGYDIRTVQELQVHADVATIMIFAHVLNKGGCGVTSPLDAM